MNEQAYKRYKNKVTFMHHLGLGSISLITSIFNKSWVESKVPPEWRVADIRPIPKGGKDLQKMESHRPMSLMLSVGQMMDRLVTNHLCYFVESMHMLTEYQPGFRHDCSTDDQLLRLSQFKSDECQQSLMQHTVVALIDYSRAYDKVWRDALLMKLSQKGTPCHIV